MKWIKVAEQLPEPGRVVYIIDEDNKLLPCFKMVEEEFFGSPIRFEASWEEGPFLGKRKYYTGYMRMIFQDLRIRNEVD